LANILDKIATGIADGIEAAVDCVTKEAGDVERRVEEEFKPLPPSTPEHNLAGDWESLKPSVYSGISRKARSLTINEILSIEDSQRLYGLVFLNEIQITTPLLQVGSYEGMLLLVRVVGTGPVSTTVSIVDPITVPTIPPTVIGILTTKTPKVSQVYFTFGNWKTQGHGSYFAAFSNSRYGGHWPMMPARIQIDVGINNGVGLITQGQIRIWGNVL
jgi:hypothetical protein